MRVIAGRLRGRRLHAARGRDVRPTAERVREALFSILGDAVAGSAVLDLFAGTGALSIEALSRGARHATCVERDPRALAVLGRNVDELGLAGRVTIVRADAVDHARRAERSGVAYDIVFCDPPYRLPLEPIGDSVIGAGWWTTAVALEHGSATAPPEAPPGVEADTRRYGDTAITLYVRT